MDSICWYTSAYRLLNSHAMPGYTRYPADGDASASAKMKAAAAARVSMPCCASSWALEEGRVGKGSDRVVRVAVIKRGTVAR